MADELVAKFKLAYEPGNAVSGFKGDIKKIVEASKAAGKEQKTLFADITKDIATSFSPKNADEFITKVTKVGKELGAIYTDLSAKKPKFFTDDMLKSLGADRTKLKSAVSRIGTDMGKALETPMMESIHAVLANTREAFKSADPKVFSKGILSASTEMKKLQSVARMLKIDMGQVFAKSPIEGLGRVVGNLTAQKIDVDRLFNLREAGKRAGTVISNEMLKSAQKVSANRQGGIISFLGGSVENTMNKLGLAYEHALQEGGRKAGVGAKKTFDNTLEYLRKTGVVTEKFVANFQRKYSFEEMANRARNVISLREAFADMSGVGESDTAISKVQVQAGKDVVKTLRQQAQEAKKTASAEQGRNVIMGHSAAQLDEQKTKTVALVESSMRLRQALLQLDTVYGTLTDKQIKATKKPEVVTRAQGDVAKALNEYKTLGGKIEPVLQDIGGELKTIAADSLAAFLKLGPTKISNALKAYSVLSKKTSTVVDTAPKGIEDQLLARQREIEDRIAKIDTSGTLNAVQKGQITRLVKAKKELEKQLLPTDKVTPLADLTKEEQAQIAASKRAIARAKKSYEDIKDIGMGKDDREAFRVSTANTVLKEEQKIAGIRLRATRENNKQVLSDIAATVAKIEEIQSAPQLSPKLKRERVALQAELGQIEKSFQALDRVIVKTGEDAKGSISREKGPAVVSFKEAGLGKIVSESKARRIAELNSDEYAKIIEDQINDQVKSGEITRREAAKQRDMMKAHLAEQTTAILKETHAASVVALNDDEKVAYGNKLQAIEAGEKVTSHLTQKLEAGYLMQRKVNETAADYAKRIEAQKAVWAAYSDYGKKLKTMGLGEEELADLRMRLRAPGEGKQSLADKAETLLGLVNREVENRFSDQTKDVLNVGKKAAKTKTRQKVSIPAEYTDPFEQELYNALAQSFALKKSNIGDLIGAIPEKPIQDVAKKMHTQIKSTFSKEFADQGILIPNDLVDKMQTKMKQSVASKGGLRMTNVNILGGLLKQALKINTPEFTGKEEAMTVTKILNGIFKNVNKSLDDGSKIAGDTLANIRTKLGGFGKAASAAVRESFAGTKSTQLAGAEKSNWVVPLFKTMKASTANDITAIEREIGLRSTALSTVLGSVKKNTKAVREFADFQNSPTGKAISKLVTSQIPDLLNEASGKLNKGAADRFRDNLETFFGGALPKPSVLNKAIGESLKGMASLTRTQAKTLRDMMKGVSEQLYADQGTSRAEDVRQKAVIQRMVGAQKVMEIIGATKKETRSAMEAAANGATMDLLEGVLQGKKNAYEQFVASATGPKQTAVIKKVFAKIDADEKQAVAEARAQRKGGIDPKELTTTPRLTPAQTKGLTEDQIKNYFPKWMTEGKGLGVQLAEYFKKNIGSRGEISKRMQAEVNQTSSDMLTALVKARPATDWTDANIRKFIESISGLGGLNKKQVGTVKKLFTNFFGPALVEAKAATKEFQAQVAAVGATTDAQREAAAKDVSNIPSKASAAQDKALAAAMGMGLKKKQATAYAENIRQATQTLENLVMAQKDADTRLASRAKAIDTAHGRALVLNALRNEAAQEEQIGELVAKVRKANGPRAILEAGKELKAKLAAQEVYLTDLQQGNTKGRSATKGGVTPESDSIAGMMKRNALDSLTLEEKALYLAEKDIQKELREIGRRKQKSARERAALLRSLDKQEAEFNRQAAEQRAKDAASEQKRNVRQWEKDLADAQKADVAMSKLATGGKAQGYTLSEQIRQRLAAIREWNKAADTVEKTKKVFNPPRVAGLDKGITAAATETAGAITSAADTVIAATQKAAQRVVKAAKAKPAGYGSGGVKALSKVLPLTAAEIRAEGSQAAAAIQDAAVLTDAQLAQWSSDLQKRGAKFQPMARKKTRPGNAYWLPIDPEDLPKAVSAVKSKLDWSAAEINKWVERRRMTTMGFFSAKAPAAAVVEADKQVTLVAKSIKRSIDREATGMDQYLARRGTQKAVAMPVPLPDAKQVAAAWKGVRSSFERETPILEGLVDRYSRIFGTGVVPRPQTNAAAVKKFLEAGQRLLTAGAQQVGTEAVALVKRIESPLDAFAKRTQKYAAGTRAVTAPKIPDAIAGSGPKLLTDLTQSTLNDPNWQVLQNLQQAARTVTQLRAAQNKKGAAPISREDAITLRVAETQLNSMKKSLDGLGTVMRVAKDGSLQFFDGLKLVDNAWPNITQNTGEVLKQIGYAVDATARAATRIQLEARKASRYEQNTGGTSKLRDNLLRNNFELLAQYQQKSADSEKRSVADAEKNARVKANLAKGIAADELKAAQGIAKVDRNQAQQDTVDAARIQRRQAESENSYARQIELRARQSEIENKIAETVKQVRADLKASGTPVGKTDAERKALEDASYQILRKKIGDTSTLKLLQDQMAQNAFKSNTELEGNMARQLQILAAQHKAGQLNLDDYKKQIDAVKNLGYAQTVALESKRLFGTKAPKEAEIKTPTLDPSLVTNWDKLAYVQDKINSLDFKNEKELLSTLKNQDTIVKAIGRDLDLSTEAGKRFYSEIIRGAKEAGAKASQMLPGELQKRLAQEVANSHKELGNQMAELAKGSLTRFSSTEQFEQAFVTLRRKAEETFASMPGEAKKATDRIDAEFARLGPLMEEKLKRVNFGEALSRQVGNLDQRLNQLSYRFQHASWQMGLLGGLGLAALTKATQAAAKFVEETTPIAAVMASNTKSMAEFDNILKTIQDTSMAMATQTVYSTTEINQALMALSQTGLTTKEIFANLPEILNFAAAGSLKLDDAVRSAVSTMTAFGLRTGEITTATRAMTSAALLTNAEVGDMTEAFKHVGPVAAMAGISVEQAAAAVGELSQQGIRGSMAGTGLKRSISELIAPTGKATKLLNALGIDAIDPLTHTLKPLPDVIDEFQAAFNRLGPSADKTGIIMQIFGMRAGPSMAALINKGSQSLRDLEARLKEGADQADEIANKKANSMAGLFKRVGQAMNNLRIAMGEIVDVPIFNTLLEMSANLIDNFRKLTQTTTGKWLMGITLAVVGFTSVLATAFGAITMFGSALTGVASLLVTLARGGNMAGLKGIWQEMLLVFGSNKTAVRALSTEMEILTLSQKEMATVLRALPIEQKLALDSTIQLTAAEKELVIAARAVGTAHALSALEIEKSAISTKLAAAATDAERLAYERDLLAIETKILAVEKEIVSDKELAGSKAKATVALDAEAAALDRTAIAADREAIAAERAAIANKNLGVSAVAAGAGMGAAGAGAAAGASTGLFATIKGWLGLGKAAKEGSAAAEAGAKVAGKGLGSLGKIGSAIGSKLGKGFLANIFGGPVGWVLDIILVGSILKDIYGWLVPFAGERKKTSDELDKLDAYKNVFKKEDKMPSMRDVVEMTPEARNQYQNDAEKFAAYWRAKKEEATQHIETAKGTTLFVSSAERQQLKNAEEMLRLAETRLGVIERSAKLQGNIDTRTWDNLQEKLTDMLGKNPEVTGIKGLMGERAKDVEDIIASYSEIKQQDIELAQSQAANAIAAQRDLSDTGKAVTELYRTYSSQYSQISDQLGKNSADSWAAAQTNVSSATYEYKERKKLAQAANAIDTSYLNDTIALTRQTFDARLGIVQAYLDTELGIIEEGLGAEADASQRNSELVLDTKRLIYNEALKQEREYQKTLQKNEKAYAKERVKIETDMLKDLESAQDRYKEANAPPDAVFTGSKLGTANTKTHFTELMNAQEAWDKFYDHLDKRNQYLKQGQYELADAAQKAADSAASSMTAIKKQLVGEAFNSGSKWLRDAIKDTTSIGKETGVWIDKLKDLRKLPRYQREQAVLDMIKQIEVAERKSLETAADIGKQKLSANQELRDVNLEYLNQVENAMSKIRSQLEAISGVSGFSEFKVPLDNLRAGDDVLSDIVKRLEQVADNGDMRFSATETQTLKNATKVINNLIAQTGKKVDIRTDLKPTQDFKVISKKIVRLLDADKKTVKLFVRADTVSLAEAEKLKTQLEKQGKKVEIIKDPALVESAFKAALSSIPAVAAAEQQAARATGAVAREEVQKTSDVRDKNRTEHGDKDKTAAQESGEVIRKSIEEGHTKGGEAGSKAITESNAKAAKAVGESYEKTLSGLIAVSADIMKERFGAVADGLVRVVSNIARTIAGFDVTQKAVKGTKDIADFWSDWISDGMASWDKWIAYGVKKREKLLAEEKKGRAGEKTNFPTGEAWVAIENELGEGTADKLEQAGITLGDNIAEGTLKALAEAKQRYAEITKDIQIGNISNDADLKRAKEEQQLLLDLIGTLSKYRKELVGVAADKAKIPEAPKGGWGISAEQLAAARAGGSVGNAPTDWKAKLQASGSFSVGEKVSGGIDDEIAKAKAAVKDVDDATRKAHAAALSTTVSTLDAKTVGATVKQEFDKTLGSWVYRFDDTLLKEAQARVTAAESALKSLAAHAPKLADPKKSTLSDDRARQAMYQMEKRSYDEAVAKQQLELKNAQKLLVLEESKQALLKKPLPEAAAAPTVVVAPEVAPKAVAAVQATLTAPQKVEVTPVVTKPAEVISPEAPKQAAAVSKTVTEIKTTTVDTKIEEEKRLALAKKLADEKEREAKAAEAVLAAETKNAEAAAKAQADAKALAAAKAASESRDKAMAAEAIKAAESQKSAAAAQAALDRQAAADAKVAADAKAKAAADAAAATRVEAEVKKAATPTVTAAPVEVPKATAITEALSSGKRIIIDAGHGGSDSGAVGVGGAKEATYTKAVAEKVVELLKAKGWEVSTLGEGMKPSDRKTAINAASPDAVVSVHFNAATSANWSGALTLFGDDVDKKLATSLQSAISKVGFKDLGAKLQEEVGRTNLALLNTPKTPSAIVEAGFMTSPEDLAKIKNVGVVAQGIVDGIENWNTSLNEELAKTTPTVPASLTTAGAAIDKANPVVPKALTDAGTAIAAGAKAVIDAFAKMAPGSTPAAAGDTKKLAVGGKLPGYGGGDIVPAMLEPGEFVLRKEAVAKYGSAKIHALNRGHVQKFQEGGEVKKEWWEYGGAIDSAIKSALTPVERPLESDLGLDAANVVNNAAKSIASMAYETFTNPAEALGSMGKILIGAYNTVAPREMAIPGQEESVAAFKSTFSTPTLSELYQNPLGPAMAVALVGGAAEGAGGLKAAYDSSAIKSSVTDAVKKASEPLKNETGAVGNPEAVKKVATTVETDLGVNKKSEVASQIAKSTESSGLKKIDIQYLQSQGATFVGEGLKNQSILAKGQEAAVYVPKDLIEAGKKPDKVMKVAFPDKYTEGSSAAIDSFNAKVKDFLSRDKQVGSGTMELAGYYEHNKTKVPVFMQKYFEGNAASDAMVIKYMTDKGYTKAPSSTAKWEFERVEGDNLRVVGDLLGGGPEGRSKNVVFTKDGKVEVLDSMMRLVKKAQVDAKRAAKAPGYSEGGSLDGFGGGDVVPARLEPGEFVVRKEAVQKYGTHFFDILNGLKAQATNFIPRVSGVKGFAAGGQVGSSVSSPLSLAGKYQLNLSLSGKEGTTTTQLYGEKAMIETLVRALDRESKVKVKRS